MVSSQHLPLCKNTDWLSIRQLLDVHYAHYFDPTVEWLNTAISHVMMIKLHPVPSSSSPAHHILVQLEVFLLDKSAEVQVILRTGGHPETEQRLRL